VTRSEPVARGDRWCARLFGGLVLADLAHRAIQVANGPFPLHTDSLGYWRMAKTLAETGSLLAADPLGHRTPVYPLLVACSYRLFGEWGLQGVVLLQNLFGVATALLVADLCRRLSGTRWAAVAGYGLVAAALGRVQYDQQLMTESLFVLLLTLHLWLLSYALERRSAGFAGFAGLVLGVSALTRPVASLLGAAEVLSLLVVSRGAARRSTVVPLLAMLAGTVVPVVAWMARNAVRFGEPSVALVTRVNSWEHHFRPGGAALDLPGEAAERLPPGLDWRNGFQVRESLLASGSSETEAARWMRSVASAARSQQARAYRSALARHSLRFWTTVEEAHPFYERCGPGMSDGFEGQRTICAPGVVRPVAPLLRFLYRFPPALQAAAAAAGLLAGLALLRLGDARRSLGALTLAWMLYFPTVTVLVLFPLYRFRMILGPCLAAAFVVGVASVLPRSRHYDSGSIRPEGSTDRRP